MLYTRIWTANHVTVKGDLEEVKLYSVYYTDNKRSLHSRQWICKSINNNVNKCIFMYMPYVLLGILIKALTGRWVSRGEVQMKALWTESWKHHVVKCCSKALLSNLLQVPSPSCVKSQATFEDRSIAANRQRDIREQTRGLKTKSIAKHFLTLDKIR